MKEITLCLFSIAALIILNSNDAFACSCIYVPDAPLTKQVKEAKDTSNAVFTGKVLEVTKNTESGKRIKLQIINLWKGKLSKEVTLLTGNDDGDCGYPFEVDKTYLVYAYRSTMYSAVESLVTTICSRTKSSEDAKKEIKVLGRGKNFKNQNKNVLPDNVKSGGKIGTGENDAWLWLKIRSMLLANDEMRGAEIVVDVTDAKVILRGKVENKVQKTKAEQLTWSMEGVKAVTNNLEIASPK